MRICFFYFLIVLLGNLSIAFSQQKDSSEVGEKPKKIYYFHQAQFNTGDTTVNSLDTLLDNVQIYRDRNNLGNNGLPGILLSPVYLADIGLNYSQNNLVNYSFTKNNIKYYNTTAPYTQIIYVLGAKKEQDLKALHTQNVNKNLNFSAAFNRSRSDGFYQRQNTNNNSFNLSSNYRSGNQRYALLSNLILNSLKYAENGGIENDTTFENGLTLNKSLIGINLNSAQRKIRERSFFIQQFINLGSIREKKLNDSVTVKKMTPKSSLSHSLYVKDNRHEYFDNETNESTFYSNYFRDTSTTADSLYYWNIENELTWQTIKRPLDNGKWKIGAKAGIKHDLMELRQYVSTSDTMRNLYDTSFNNIIAQGRLYNYGKGQKTLFDIYGKYVVKGYGEGGYDYGITLKQLIKNDSNYIQFQGIMKQQAPDLFYQRYVSNHFEWYNQFNKISTQWLDLRFVSKKLFLEFGGSMIQYNNFVYLDNSINPKQFNQTFKIASGFLNKDFHIEAFTLSNKLTYQKIIDSSVIRIPEIVASQSLFFTMRLFKKALIANIGIDIFYNSYYYANNYMPALGQFYLQNNKQVGNYPYFDVFLSMKIRSARIFLKYEHFNSDLIENRYYAAPNYPMPDKAFKFGINWYVFN